MKGAKEIIETFWKIQDEGDYTKVVAIDFGIKKSI